MSDEEYERAWRHVLRDLNEAWEEIKRLKAELASRTRGPADREAAGEEGGEAVSKTEFIEGIIRDVEAGKTVHVTGRKRLLAVIDWITTDTTDRTGWTIGTSIDNSSLWIRKGARP